MKNVLKLLFLPVLIPLYIICLPLIVSWWFIKIIFWIAVLWILSGFLLGLTGSD